MEYPASSLPLRSSSLSTLFGGRGWPGEAWLGVARGGAGLYGWPWHEVARDDHACLGDCPRCSLGYAPALLYLLRILPHSVLHLEEWVDHVPTGVYGGLGLRGFVGTTSFYWHNG